MVILCSSLAACPSSTTTGADYRRHSDPLATVDSPRVAVVAAGEEMEMQGYWTADVVTGATPVMAAPDVYTRATEFSETRHEVGVGAQWQRGDASSPSAWVRTSRESDYASQAASASVAREFRERHLRLSATKRAVYDRVGRVDDPGFSESLWSSGLATEATYAMRPDLVGHLTWDVQGQFGYQHNPYRMVPLFEGGVPTAVVAERHPERRIRHAVEPVAIWSFDEAWFLHGRYRFYADDWGVRSHTVGAELWRTWLDDRLRGRLRLRGYGQQGARFYRARYDALGTYRSGDYRLSTMGSVAAGARVDIRPSPFGERRLRVSAAYDVTHYRFVDYAPRTSMTARSLGLSLGMEWER